MEEQQQKFSDILGPSPEANQCLLQKNESEIKFLEGIRIYIEKRAKIDSDYAEKVSKLHNVIKMDVSTNEDDGFLEKAWKTYVNETENKAITMSQMVKGLQTSVLSKLDKIINSKGAILKQYRQDRSKSDLDFKCSKDEIKRLSDIYRLTIKDAVKTREKLDELCSKGKGDKEWKKMKDKLDKVCLKLHTTHNDYLLSVKVATEHQTSYNSNVVPYLLNSMQEIQEGFVDEMKSVLMEIFENTNWCSDEFITSSKQIEGTIKMVEKGHEYRSFLSKNKIEPQPTIPFYFDETLIEDSKTATGLEQDQLALNDLTHEQLKYRMKSLEQQLDTIKAELKLKEEAINKVELDLKDLENGNKAEEFCKLSVLEKTAQRFHINREVNDLSCKEKLAQIQLEHVAEKVNELGDGPPPAYIELANPSEIKNNDRKDRSRSLNVYEKKTKPDKKERRSMFAGKKSRSPATMSPTHHNESNHNDSTMSEDELGEYVEPPEETSSIDNEPWFHGSIDRRAAERLLKNDGDFLIREKSDGSGAYVVSVLCRDSHKHFLLNKTEDGRYKFEGDAFESVSALINHHHVNCVPIKSADHVLIVRPVRPAFFKGDKFSFPSTDVRLDTKLGNGHFGDVYKGFLQSKKISVAIKTCKEGIDEIKKKQFLEEAEIMKPYNHPNVVKLIGICNDKEPFMILMELMPYGDLLNFLKKRGTNLGLKDLLRLGHDAAKGMSYLEQKNTIHRDLAARNVLIGDNYVAKISDFGMSREEDDEGIYQIQTTKEIPIKWTAPEVWHYQTYTSKSDVWSYGILLWEIFSMGSVPYPGWNNKRTREMIETNYRMPMPLGTPVPVYEIMKKCWLYDAVERPNFAEIEKEISSIKA